MPRATTVYDHLPPIDGEVRVEHLSTDEVLRVAAPLMRASLACYSAQFERKDGPLEPGTLVRTLYNLDADEIRIRAFRRRVEEEGEAGSSYSVAWNPDHPEHIRAFVKITPASVVRRRGWLIDQVVTTPNNPTNKRRGLAAACLHAALTLPINKFGVNDPICVRGFDDTQNSKDLLGGLFALERGRNLTSAAVLGGLDQVPQHLRYAQSLGKVVASLEATNAGLSRGRISKT